MRELPTDIDADVVIEIGRLLDDRAYTSPVPVHSMVTDVRARVETRLSDQAIEELVVEMAATRGLPMVFSKTAA